MHFYRYHATSELFGKRGGTVVPAGARFVIEVALFWHMLAMNLTVHRMMAPPVSHLKRKE